MTGSPQRICWATALCQQQLLALQENCPGSTTCPSVCRVSTQLAEQIDTPGQRTQFAGPYNDLAILMATNLIDVQGQLQVATGRIIEGQDIHQAVEPDHDHLWIHDGPAVLPYGLQFCQMLLQFSLTLQGRG
jgi:hypothetical protein